LAYRGEEGKEKGNVGSLRVARPTKRGGRGEKNCCANPPFRLGVNRKRWKEEYPKKVWGEGRRKGMARAPYTPVRFFTNVLKKKKKKKRVGGMPLRERERNHAVIVPSYTTDRGWGEKRGEQVYCVSKREKK